MWERAKDQAILWNQDEKTKKIEWEGDDEEVTAGGPQSESSERETKNQNQRTN